MTTDLCWCGSGKAYADCHSEIDSKIELYRKAGHEVPDREMIKTPEQIAGIREACKINTAVLDEVEKISNRHDNGRDQYYRTTNIPLVMVRSRHRLISADFLKVSVPRSTIRFATEYRRHRTF